MAASVIKISVCYGYVLHLFLVFNLSFRINSVVGVPVLRPIDILEAATSTCSVLFPQPVLANEQVKNLLIILSQETFVNESGVLLGVIQQVPTSWPNGKSFQVTGESDSEDPHNSIFLFKRMKRDRTCLLVPEGNIAVPTAVVFSLGLLQKAKFGPFVEKIIDFINEQCGTFRTQSGSLNLAGIHRREILENVYSTTVVEPKHQDCLGVTSIYHAEHKNNICRKKLKVESSNDVNSPADDGRGRVNEFEAKNRHLQECERINVPTSSQFFHEYLARSKPVIITGATANWAAFQKWSNVFLKENFGNKKVHIKMTPDGQYEGVEPISLWENYKRFQIPKSVYNQLPYPDLVVVRPASMEVEFSEFIDRIENISMGKVNNISAYLEYSSIHDYFPELVEDIKEMSFFKNVLSLKHLNIWLSDGNTLGKLHFDPFDNFLCQIDGVKQVLMYEPHDNTRLYEGHIQEAALSYNTTENLFYRKNLLDSTSMVMSPVDLLTPDLKRFPKFASVRPLNCTIQPGEVLFMPSFWWHEVQSKPGSLGHRNLAVNFWYEPFLTREFPCPECKLDVNMKYSHLL